MAPKKPLPENHSKKALPVVGGATARAICDVAGIRYAYTKQLRVRNRMKNAIAFLDAQRK